MTLGGFRNPSYFSVEKKGTCRSIMEENVTISIKVVLGVEITRRPLYVRGLRFKYGVEFSRGTSRREGSEGPIQIPEISVVCSGSFVFLSEGEDLKVRITHE